MIVHISRIEEDIAIGHIWQWSTDALVRFPTARIPTPHPAGPFPWLFLGRAKIDEDKMQDLDIQIEEVAPEPDGSDGLA